MKFGLLVGTAVMLGVAGGASDAQLEAARILVRSVDYSRRGRDHCAPRDDDHPISPNRPL